MQTIILFTCRLPGVYFAQMIIHFTKMLLPIGSIAQSKEDHFGIKYLIASQLISCLLKLFYCRESEQNVSFAW